MFWLVDLFEVPAALAADAHTGDVQLLAGRRLAGAAQNVAGDDGDSRCGGAAANASRRVKWLLGFIGGSPGKVANRHSDETEYTPSTSVWEKRLVCRIMTARTPRAMWRLTPVNPYPGLFNVGWVKHGSPGNGALREPVQNSDTCSQGFDSATMGTWCPNPPFSGRFASRTHPCKGPKEAFFASFSWFFAVESSHSDRPTPGNLGKQGTSWTLTGVASRTLPLLAVGKVTIEAMEAAKSYRPAG